MTGQKIVQACLRDRSLSSGSDVRFAEVRSILLPKRVVPSVKPRLFSSSAPHNDPVFFAHRNRAELTVRWRPILALIGAEKEATGNRTKFHRSPTV